MASFFGWLIGVLVGMFAVALLLLGLTVPLPPGLSAVGNIVAPIASAIGPTWVIILSIVLVVGAYIWAYILATMALSAAPGFPAGFTPPIFANFPTPAGVAVLITSPPAELFSRAFCAGLTATLNAVVLALLPGLLFSVIFPVWAFVLISLAAVPAVTLDRIYQGLLGWSAWLFPVSHLATAVGALYFVINFIPALFSAGLAAFRIDWSTGVIETAGGLSGIGGFRGGFSLGNFTFVTIPGAPLPGGAGGLQGSFFVSNVSTHETGHSLNTAAFGGVVLWINAVDENIPPLRKMNMSYGELMAESHSQAMPTPTRNDFFIRVWG